MRKGSVLRGFLTIAVVCLFVACGDDPSPVKPSQLSPSGFAGIEVTGPDWVFPGQSVQFVANIRQADGTTKSATSMPNLRWRSSNPAAVSVSNSGVVTATPWAFGEAVITADITEQGTVQGTRQVAIRQRVTAELEISQQGTEPDQVFYVFALKLTEWAGVPTTVTEVWINFDLGSNGGCSWAPYKLGQARLPANGTLALEPLNCGDFHKKPFDVLVSIWLTEDNGYQTYAELYRVL